MGAGIGRDQQGRHAYAAGQRQPVRPEGQDPGRHVVIEPVRLVVGDDDGALVPHLRPGRDGVDDAGHHRFAELTVAVAGVVVVAGLGLADRGTVGVRERGRVVRVGHGRREAGQVGEAAADVEHAAVGREVALPHVAEEVAEAAKVGLVGRVVGDVAEILWPLVVADVAVVAGVGGLVRGFVVVAFLVPAPGDRLAGARCDRGKVVPDVGLIGVGVPVRLHRPGRVLAAQRQRHGREGEVLGDVAVRVAFLRPGRLPPGNARGVELRAPERLRVVHERHALERAFLAVHRRLLAVAAVLHPLRLAGLPGDHGDGVGRGGRVLGGEDVVVEDEVAGPAPVVGDGVTVHVAHHELGELPAHGDVRRPAAVGVAAILGGGEPVHGGLRAVHVQLGRESSVAMVHAVHHRAVLFRPQPHRADRHVRAARARVVLLEAGRMGRVARVGAVGEQAVGAWEGAELVVEGVVLVEDDENILDLAPQRLDQRIPVRHGVGQRADMGLHVRRRVRLGGQHRGCGPGLSRCQHRHRRHQQLPHAALPFVSRPHRAWSAGPECDGFVKPRQQDRTGVGPELREAPADGPGPRIAAGLAFPP